ncbi:MAG: AAA family ATPase [Candidatus Accumulibacter sp.]|jgi:MoxR-like ATPase|nr:AAA family ATPase [Accumulibacter sp.]
MRHELSHSCGKWHLSYNRRVDPEEGFTPVIPFFAKYRSPHVPVQNDLHRPRRRPARFFLGPPGIGKSAIVRQVAETRGWTESNRRFVDVRLSQMEPVDLRGLPALDLAARKTVWLPPAWLPFEGSDWPDEGVLFLDEASSAAPSVQAAAYQLVLDRQLGEARMKRGWRLALAGNRVSDGGVAFRLAMPLANRMQCKD